MRPVASKRTLQRRLRYWAKLMGFVRPWRTRMEFRDHRQDEWIDPKDKDCYAAHEYQPQYHRGIVYCDPRHPNWRKEIHGLDSLLRHELGHGVTSPLYQFALHLVENFATDDATKAAMVDQLNDADDTVVTWIAEMPGLADRGDE